jgi:hypothetical protein
MNLLLHIITLVHFHYYIIIGNNRCYYLLLHITDCRTCRCRHAGGDDAAASERHWARDCRLGPAAAALTAWLTLPPSGAWAAPAMRPGRAASRRGRDRWRAVSCPDSNFGDAHGSLTPTIKVVKAIKAIHEVSAVEIKQQNFFKFIIRHLSLTKTWYQ